MCPQEGSPQRGSWGVLRPPVGLCYPFCCMEVCGPDSRSQEMVWTRVRGREDGKRQGDRGRQHITGAPFTTVGSGWNPGRVLDTQPVQVQVPSLWDHGVYSAAHPPPGLCPQPPSSQREQRSSHKSQKSLVASAHAQMSTFHMSETLWCHVST
ncbi:uncharacterized protein LOC132533941 isoform X2 [Erinaceus europaeus]|uniref:Uncharacterized protein LOC132533941 isoform X2 n=1 Tax=Erinaceus europaeus TaxID=9365 RepID=A0ABM3W9Q1_ERIEU|nr:uncharacterized protein LOC132533941 isoform X2 [Erinaceus europaeus]